MPINRVCFARAAACRRHGADSVGNSGQREEEESIVNRGSDRTARTAPDRTARTAPDSFGQQTAGQQTARQQAQPQRLATTLQRWEGRCWAVVLNPPNNKSLN